MRPFVAGIIKYDGRLLVSDSSVRKAALDASPIRILKSSPENFSTLGSLSTPAIRALVKYYRHDRSDAGLMRGRPTPSSIKQKS
ncbi:hypothetical protein [Sulfitobacter sp.]|uniref:hypothetical protein n=1 Tax=Sulfitobacter sp. TaxID=1903071 RepID=UPI0035639769